MNTKKAEKTDLDFSIKKHLHLQVLFALKSAFTIFAILL